MKSTLEKQKWTQSFRKHSMAYPAEYVIRIFKGTYPRLKLSQNVFTDKKICDISCGDGRNTAFLKTCGFDVYGTEITPEIVDKARENLRKSGIVDVTVKVGTNDSIDFKDNFFDYLLAWNSCYYMGEGRDFSRHVLEYTRVLKKGGWLIFSIPKKTCFIYQGSRKLNNGYRVILKDPFNVRNGSVLKCFEGAKDIQENFSSFKNFTFASVEDDCFGFNYHAYLVVCQKR